MKVVEAPAIPVTGLDPGRTATSVVSKTHVGLLPLNRVAVKGEEPPVHEAGKLMDTDCPRSITDGVGAVREAASTGLTLKRNVAEVAATGEVTLSITVAQ